MGDLEHYRRQLQGVENYLLAMHSTYQTNYEHSHENVYLYRMDTLISVLNFLAHASNGEFGRRYEMWDFTAGRGEQGTGREETS